MKSAVTTAALVLVFVATAVSLATSPATHTINPTEWRQEAARAQAGKYPTMLEMTFPEFETAVRGTDIILLPIGDRPASETPPIHRLYNRSAKPFRWACANVTRRIMTTISISRTVH